MITYVEAVGLYRIDCDVCGLGFQIAADNPYHVAEAARKRGWRIIPTMKAIHLCNSCDLDRQYYGLPSVIVERDELRKRLHDYDTTDVTIAIQGREEARDQLRAALAEGDRHRRAMEKLARRLSKFTHDFPSNHISEILRECNAEAADDVERDEGGST